MASILEVKNGTTTLLPTTTWAAPNGLFGATADRNDGSIYGWADSTSTITLPASGLANGYAVLWGFEFEDTSNGRHNPQGRMVQASGTGNFASAATGGYNRDNSEDRSYVSGWSFIDSPSASATLQFQWRRDTDAPTGGTVRSFIQVIPLYYADVGIYTSTSTTATGGTTPVQIGSLTGTDGTNITVASSTVTMTGDNKRYLVLGSAYHQSIGNARTQRWYGLRVDGTKDDAAKGCQYYRNTSNADGGESFIRLLETVTASRTVDLFQYRGDGVAAGQGGADVDGNVTGANSQHALVVIELNDAAEVYSSVDSVGGQEFALAGPVDVDIASTGDIEFSDAASFTRVSDTAVNVEVTTDVFAFANISHARESGSIGSGSRWTVHGEFTINGTEVTDVGFHGNYNRGNQSSEDCHGSSCNQAGVFAITADEDIGVSNQELAGTEGGAGDIETQAGWVGFGLINLDTLEAAGTPDLVVDDFPTPEELTLTGNAPTRFVEESVSPASTSLTLTGYVATKNTGFRLNGLVPTIDLTTSDNVVEEPGTGSLALTGETPTAATTANIWIDVDAGALSITGETPTVEVSLSVYPDLGSLVLTGEIPLMDQTANHIRAPPVSALALTGLVPTLDTGANIIEQPDAGSLTLTGYEPTLDLTANHFSDPATGSAGLTGYAPSLDYSWTVLPNSGTLSLTGQVPVATAADNKTTDPDIGSLSLTGYAATALVSETAFPDIGSLTLTGYIPVKTGGPGLRLDGLAPTVVIALAPGNVEPITGSLTLTGQTPTADTTANIIELPDAGALTLTGLTPTADTKANQSSDPLTGGLTLTGYAPTYSFSWTVSPDSGSLTLTGQVPDTDIGAGSINREPGAGSLSLTGLSPDASVSTNLTVYPNTGSLPLVGLIPTPSLFDLNQTVEPGTGTLSLTGNLEYNYGGPGLRLIGYEPILSAGGELVQVGAGALSLAGLQPVASESETLIGGAAGSLSLSGQTPTISISGDVTVQPDVGSIGLTPYTPTIDVSATTVAPDTGSLTLNGLAPTVESRNDLTVLPGKGTLNLTTYLEYNYGGPGLRLIGYEPTLVDTSVSGQVGPDNGILSIEAHRPSLEITLIPAVFDILIITGQTPDAVTTANHFPETGTGSLSLGGLVPSVPDIGPPIPIQIPVGDKALNLAGYAPSLGYDWTVTPDAGELTLTGYNFTLDSVLGPLPIGSLELNGQVPRVDYAPEPTPLTLTGYEPDLTVLGVLPIGSTSALNLNGQVPTIINSGELAEEEQPSGGYPDIWSDFESELARRKREREERRKARAKAKRIKDRLDRQLALEQRKIEEEEARQAELARIAQLVESNQSAIEAMGSERLEFVVKEALERRTYSTIERLERELAKAHEEEVFLLMAAQVMINQ